MQKTNYETRLRNYLKVNPKLTNDEIGCLLLIDYFYDNEPKKLDYFRSLYPHFDPAIITSDEPDGIMFLKIAKSNEPESVIKHRLNSYFNVKSNFIDYYNTYEENKRRFSKASYFISKLIDDFLERSGLPESLKETLRENEKVRKCYDLTDMLKLYKKTRSQRTRFEIMRKIGLIVLTKRIRRNYFIDDMDFAMEKLKRVFKKGLGTTKNESKTYYFWPDENDKVDFDGKKEEAIIRYEKAIKKRKSLAKNIYPLQKINCSPTNTKYGKFILHSEFRNKLRKNGQLEYTSIVEKMLRKNLTFPSQVRDVLGVRLVVENEDIIPLLIHDIENFLGGSSARNLEKTGLNMFGKKKLSNYSSEDFYVWKAVYDITLPHPTSRLLEKMLSLTKENDEVKKLLREQLEYLKKHPKDFIVEVQIQDMQSYLQGICRGTNSYHDYMKRRQIRDNSFYKMFPKEIYEDELNKLKKNIIKKSF